jgi:hypothetical protein
VPYAYLPARPGPLRVDGFARVVADDLVIRSDPFAGPGSDILEPHLSAGQRLFIVAGPVAGSGYDWYQMQSMPSDDQSPRPFGWVAAASRDGVPWIEGLDVACPGGAPNIAVLVTLAPEERRACYGDGAHTFAAWGRGIALVDGPGPEDGSPAITSFWIVGGRDGRTMEAVLAVPDASGRSPDPASSAGQCQMGGVNGRYRLTGHFTPWVFVVTSCEYLGGS